MDKIFAPIKGRILEYIDYKNITKESFYKESGVTASNFKGKGIESELGGDKIAKILSLYDDLNAEWLLTGNGDMIKKPNTKVIEALRNKVVDKEETRPRVPYSAAAGFLSVVMDGVTVNQCEQMPLIKAFACYDFTILAYGDSMLPEYHSGDELACLYIKNTSYVQWGRCHVLDTAQGIIVKRIFDSGEFIHCMSDNEDYKEFKIHKSEVYSISLVIGMLRRY